MRTFKRAAVFILVNILAAGVLHFLLAEPTGFAYRMDDFKKENYTTVGLGHSWAQNGVDPRGLETGEGDRAFNLGQGFLPLRAMPAVLGELEKTSDIKRVYLDLCTMYWEKDYVLNAMTSPSIMGELSGWQKAEYLRDVLLEQNYNNALFAYSLNRNSVESIPDTLRKKLDPAYRNGGRDEEYRRKAYEGQGFFYVEGEGVPQEDGYYTVFSPENISPDAVRDFDRIVRHCEDKGIELICFMSALPPERIKHGDHDKIHAFYQGLCAERGLPLYDMNYVKWVYLPRTAADYTDVDGHMTGGMAKRQAELMRDITLSESPEAYFEKTYQAVLQGIAAYEAVEI